MATFNMPSKSAEAKASLADTNDLERGQNIPDSVEPSGSSRLTLNVTPSKGLTPTSRQSLEYEENARPGEAKFAPPWQKLARKLPLPIVRSGRKAGKWLRGPMPSRKYRITAFHEYLQTAPRDFLQKLHKWVRYCLFGLVFVAWAVSFGLILRQYGLPLDIEGHGPPVRLSCIDSLWPSAKACGIGGLNCLPFANSSFPFYCPADCIGTTVLNPRAVGDQSINYRPLVIGGRSELESSMWSPYRGDSFICGAAIHGQAISNAKGGCGLLTLTGEAVSFSSSLANGIDSIAFPSIFPQSFRVSALAGCEDPRWKLLPLSVVFTVLFGCFSSRPATFFAPIFAITFFQIAMASDPPAYLNYASLASTALGRFLPAALAAVVIHRICVHRALKGCHAHFEKTVLWVGGAWVGALSNYTFEKIPIQRLTGHDIRQQPGAIVSLVLIVLVILAVVLYQCWCLRFEGRLPQYLGIYACLGASLGPLAAIPMLNLRIHHYIIALLLLPGTAMQTRISLLCQGLLVGLFINGIERWNFDYILQTSAALRGDAQLGSNVPTIFEPVINGTSIKFTWDGLLHGWNGVSVLVNDVQRYVSNGGEEQQTYAWTTETTFPQKMETIGYPPYFRFGFVKYLPFGGVTYSDFTRAGTWFANGTWGGIPPGRT